MTTPLGYSIGDSVYCFECGLDGTIIRTDGLGLSYAPVVETTDGSKILFCGDKMRDFCGQVNLFTQTLTEHGASDDDVAAFREAWRIHADPWTQRRGWYDGLVNARASGDAPTIVAYLNTIKGLIGL